MGWLEGLLTGITERKAELEAENIRSAELSAAREANLYQALLGSDNPEIQAMAVSGLLESAQPRKRKGGLKGWLGEMEGSPTFQRLQGFLQTPRPETVTDERETLPATFGTGGTVTPSIEAVPSSAGMAPTSPVSPSGAPPTPLSYTQAPPTPYTTQRTEMRTPQIFLTPQQRAVQAAEAQGLATGAEYTATYNAVYKAERNLGASHEEAAQTARMAALGTRGLQGARYGGIVAGSSLPMGAKDSFGRPISPQGFYRRETNNGVEQFIPTLPPSAQLGTLRVLAGPQGRPAVYRIFPDNRMEYVRDVPAGVDQIPVQHPDGSMEIVPVPQQYQLPTTGSGGPPAPAAAGPPAAAAPPQEGAAPSTAPPPTVPPPAVTRGPAGGIQTKPSTAEQEATKRSATRLTSQENALYRTPEGTTWGDLDKRGFVPLEPDVRRAVDQIDIALTQIGKMDDLVKKVFAGGFPKAASVFGPAAERLAQEGSLTWAMNSEDYRNLVAAKNMAIPGVARRTGEVGNLTATEQERASESLPNLGEGAMNTPDTLAVAVSKLQTLRQQLEDQRGIFLRGRQVRGADNPMVPEELKAAPPGSVWEDEQGVPRWKKMPDGSIIPY